MASSLSACTSTVAASLEDRRPDQQLAYPAARYPDSQEFVGPEKKAMQESVRESLRAANSAASCAELQKAIATGQIKLKSDLKKSSAFVKKLKMLTDSNVAACLKDVAELNLTRYLSECVVSLVEAVVTLKPSEVGSHVQVISALHQRYGITEVTEPLLSAYVTAAFNPPAPPTNAPADPTSKQKQSKRRLVTLRVLTELYLVQVFTDITKIYDILARVVAREDPNAKAKSKGAAPAKQPPLDVTLLVSFAKYAGAEFFGPGMSPFVPQLMQQQFRSLFEQAFDSIGVMYVAQHQTVRKLEKRNMKEEVNRGELSEEHAAEFAAATALCEKLTTSITTLSEALQKPVPALPADTSDDGALSQLLVWDGNEGRAELHADGPFDDEDTRAFYEDLPDLLELVPAVVLGLSEAEVAELKAKKAARATPAEEEEPDETPVDDPDADARVETLLDASEAADGDAPPTEAEEEKPKDAKALSYHHQLDAFFATLEDMVNRDRCDKAAVAFCYTNSKAARTRLVNALFSVPRTHLELLAYYSRLAATLTGVLKDDIGGNLVKLLVQEFNYFQKKKNQYRLESKVKNIRFLAELTKFKLCPPNVGFRCLQRLFADFQGHNVVLATTYLETCGRYLYCSKYTHARTAQSLDIMMRLKTAKHLDPLAETLVQNAYYMCKPPERVARVKPPKDPVYLFVLSRLTSLRLDGVGRVVRVCRKLNWDDPRVAQWVVKSVLHVTKSQVLQLDAVCDVVAGLSRTHEELGVNLVDTTLEWLRFLLALNSYKYHQRCLGLVKLLGELFNHGLVNSVVVFETLYWLLQHGHDTTLVPMEAPLSDDALRRLDLVPDMKFDPRVPSDADDDRNVFRIRLVCALLETVGSAFDRGVSRKKLERFLVFFQHYCLAKAEIPLETEFVVLDLLEQLHPKEGYVRFESFAQADAAVQSIFALELQLAERAAAKAGAASKDAIAPIAEDDEDPDEDEESGDESGSDEEAPEATAADADPSESDDESGSDDDVEEDDEQIIVKHQQPQTTAEDEEFEKAFRAVMLSSAEARKLAPRGNADKMAIPTVVKTTHHLEAPRDESSVVFRLLKRGNKGKLEAREILVPQATSLAQHSQRQEDAGKKEQSELKRLVLLNVERDELAAQEEALASPTHAPNATQQYFEHRRRQQQQRLDGDRTYMHAHVHGRGAQWDSLESFLGANKNSGPPVQIMRPRPQQGGRGRGR
ncbi:regulator of nonsense transcripts 2 [Achlya hypogyna]|uniref:Regulator of nonsense transcripts 2 n=1 Tax=Achlya hypogyna TaxID=1202772 RepID=A0A1V9YEF4_ACHHY|nr:regulator of nonsense transcripts 2 [Achlya hypogyna]